MSIRVFPQDLLRARDTILRLVFEMEDTRSHLSQQVNSLDWRALSRTAIDDSWAMARYWEQVAREQLESMGRLLRLCVDEFTALDGAEARAFALLPIPVQVRAWRAGEKWNGAALNSHQDTQDAEEDEDA